MRLYCGSSVSSELSSYYSKRTKSILFFNTVVYWLSKFCEYILLFFNKPVYSCKDTTGKSGDEDSRNSTASRKKKRKFVEFALQLELSTMSEISELILLLNKQHQEQNKQHQEQMTMLQEQLKILQSSLNNPRENVPTPMASFQPFDSTSELWTDYLARFRTFVTANSIPDNKQAQIFLTNQSNSVYKMLSNLAAQQQPVKSIHELTMNDIQTFMAEQFDPKRFVVRERFKFWSDMKRKPGETITELASRIRQDAATCDFQSIKDPLDEALRTKFICSVDNEAAKSKTSKTQEKKTACFRCGNSGHFSKACPHIKV